MHGTLGGAMPPLEWGRGGAVARVGGVARDAEALALEPHLLAAARGCARGCAAARDRMVGGA